TRKLPSSRSNRDNPASGRCAAPKNFIVPVVTLEPDVVVHAHREHRSANLSASRGRSSIDTECVPKIPYPWFRLVELIGHGQRGPTGGMDGARRFWCPLD